MAGLLTQAAFLLGMASTCHAQTAGAVAPTPYTVIHKDGNSRTWQRTTYEVSPSGETIPHLESYTEVGSGICYLGSNGQWLDSQDVVTILPDGSGSATNGQHSVYFPVDIGTGEIKLVEPGGAELDSAPLCLTYYDGTNYSLLGQVTNSVGELISQDQVLYTNAFLGINASVLYTYTKAGLEQDVILNVQPPTPQSLGLNPDTARLQVATEFFDAAEPAVSATAVSTPIGEIEDDSLAFGTMSMVPGRAFLLGRAAPAVGIERQWVSQNGRQILVEEVPVASIVDQLAALPLVSSRNVKSPLYALSTKQPLPPRSGGRASRRNPGRICRAVGPNRGMVLDYQIINNSLTNFTFQGDTTYCISNSVYMFGGSFEGGAILKFAPSGPWTFYSTGPTIHIEGSNQVNWAAADYRPVIFTAVDDNTIGNEIGGSTGNPIGYYGDPMLEIANIDDDQTISHFRFSWAEQAVTINSSGVNFCDGQFVNCLNGITGGFTGIYLGNVLFADVMTNFDDMGSADLVADNVTFSGSACLWGQSVNTYFTFGLTNCIFADVTNLDSYPGSDTNIVGLYNGQFNSFQSGYYPGIGANQGSTSDPFTTIGGGSYYLTSDSPFRGAGTTNVDPILLADLRDKTTQPPFVYSNTDISDLGTLSPCVPRDTNNPAEGTIDLGYHYDATDFAFGGCDLESNLIVAAGTAVGCFGAGSLTYSFPYGIAVNNGGSLTFEGSATDPCVFSFADMVQEGVNGYWTAGEGGGFLGGLVFNGSSAGPEPLVSGNFTKWMPDNYRQLFRDAPGNGAGSFRNCEFYNCRASTYAMQYLTFTNCLLSRNFLAFWDEQDPEYALSFSFENCTFYNGCLAYFRYSFDPGEASSYWQIENCTFDGTAFGGSDPLRGSSTNTFFDYNSYNTNNLSWTNYPGPQPESGTNEIVGTNDLMTTDYNWQSSWFGGFYLPQSSALIQRGSTQASLLGLYWFTTQTNQTPETNAIVDIGYHYVATDTNGNPLDYLDPPVPNYISYPDGPPPAPEIITDPTNETVAQNSNAAFTVTAIGASPLSYQWFWNGFELKDGADVSGSTGPALNLGFVQPYQAGSYYVVVANAYGSATSDVAMLMVQLTDTNYPYPQYFLPPDAYWNVTDISDPAQPVKIGELQAPYSEPNYEPGGPVQFNTSWHTLNTTDLVANAFGTTEYGGTNNEGTLFRIAFSGGLTVLHTFSGPSDGAYPCSQLAISGGTFWGISNMIYGTTAAGGAYGLGTVFEASADGSEFTNLYEFTGTNDGKFPQTGLLIDGNTLYGTTSNSIFKIDTDGSDFTCLTNFIGASQLLLSLSGETLYGTTPAGGVSNLGTIFRIDKGGSGLATIYNFTGFTNGAFPESGLEILECSNAFENGSTTGVLYGTTYRGGSNNLGMVFSINTDGSGFTDLHDFAGTNDGANPAGGLLLTNNNVPWNGAAPYLYGTTSRGGTNNQGTLFGMRLDGSGFNTLYNFGGTNGVQPQGKLVIANQMLYGTTCSGGSNYGTVFGLDTENGNFVNLYEFTGGNDGGSPLAGLAVPVVDSWWSIWSLDTTIDLPEGEICQYQVAPDDSCALFVNGNLVTNILTVGPVFWQPYLPMPYLHSGQNDIRVIIGGNGDWNDYFTMEVQGFPQLPVDLYGTTFYGGDSSDGTIFEITYSGLDTIVHNFTGAPDDGNGPIGDLVLSGASMYGVTEFGGLITNNGNAAGNGTIFKIGTNGNFRALYLFTNAPDGAEPQAGLVLSSNTLYGTTGSGGTNGDGTIFKINTDGSSYEVLYNFGATSNDGINPFAPLLLVSNTLYGTTFGGGASGYKSYGTIFSISTSGTNYRTLYSFLGTPDGAEPQAGLTFVASSNALYGTTLIGGNDSNGNNYGTIFRYTLGTSTDAVLHTFVSNPDGDNPEAGLALSGNTLYGTTYQGGTNNEGIVFSLGVDGSDYVVLASLGSGDSSANPGADLLVESNVLYGTTYYGGAQGDGTVFSIDADGSNFDDIYDFLGGPEDGVEPEGGLCSP